MTTSSIDPTKPATNAALLSSDLRSNFLAAYNDINNLYAEIAAITGFTLPDGSVTAAKLAAGAAIGNIGSGTITGPMIAAGTIASANLAIGAAFGNLSGMTGTGSSLVLSQSPTLTGQPIINAASPTWGTLNALYSGFAVDVGGLPIASMNASAAGAIGMPQAIRGSLDIPATFTGNAFVSAAVAGYARNASPNPVGSAVGLFGVGMAGAASTANWGLNTIVSNTGATVPATQTGLNGVTCFSIEADVNIMKLPGGGTPTGTARGIGLFGGSEVVPSGGAYGIEIGSFGQGSNVNTVAWSGALAIDSAPNGFGIQIGANFFGGTGHGSQSLNFVSTNASGTSIVSKMFTDQDGTIIFSPAVINGAAGLVALQDNLGNTKLTAGTGGVQVNDQFRVAAAAQALPSTAVFASSPTMQIANSDSSINRILYDAVANANAISFRRADGTTASPTTLGANESIGQLSWYGYGATGGTGGYTSSARAQILGATDTAWTNTSQATHIDVLTTPNSTTPAVVARFEGAGGFTIAQSFATPAGGTANLGLQMGTAKVGVFFGSGAPTLSAAKGSLYLRTDGSSTSTRLYVNTDGATSWTNFTSAT